LILAFKRPVAEAVGLAAVMMLIYIPLGHLIDRFLYSRRQAARRRERERRARGE